MACGRRGGAGLSYSESHFLHNQKSLWVWTSVKGRSEGWEGASVDTGAEGGTSDEKPSTGQLSLLTKEHSAPPLVSIALPILLSPPLVINLFNQSIWHSLDKEE